jgi:hypothetical protein
VTGKQKLGVGILLSAIGCLGGFGLASVASDEVTPIPVQIEGRRKPESGPRVETVMEAKLEHAQKILGGLVTHDFEQIAASAESLKLISLSHPRGWEKRAEDDEVYEHFRMEFMRQAARLENEAKKENLAGAAWFQQNLTATCISCHEYIRDENTDEKR